MKLLERYIARQFVVTFLFSGLSFVALFVLISLVENLDEFIDRNIAIRDIAMYYLNGLPETFLITTPISVLLASLFVTGRMSMQNELPAVKSAGVSMTMLLKPFLTVCLVITLLNIINSCWIVPATYERKNEFESTRLEKAFTSSGKSTDLHIRESQNRMLSIGYLRPDHTGGYSVSLESFNGPVLTSRIDADSFRYIPSKKQWVFFQTRTRYFSAEEEQFTFNRETAPFRLSFTPETFRIINADPDEMNLFQLHRFIRQQTKAGFSSLERAKIKFHAKIALPCASLIIVLIGVPLSTRKKRSGLAIEAGLSLFVGFLYLGMQKTLSTIGYRGIIDPFLAAWLPNILFLCVGLQLCKWANR
jgi:lipopolysaccharide export system permease protein